MQQPYQFGAIYNPAAQDLHQKSRVYTFFTILNMLKLTIFIFLVSITTLSNGIHDSMSVCDNKTCDSLSRPISELSDQFAILEKRVAYQENLTSISNESISNQFSAASYSLTIFGILFGLLGFILGIYITYIERKVVRILEANQGLLAESNRIKIEVFDMNKLIQENVYGLYEKIRRADTLHMLERLREVPEDIANLSSALLSRELAHEDFQILKEAYFKVEDEEDEEVGLRMTFKNSYKLLFFQHFLNIAIKDNRVGPPPLPREFLRVHT